MKIFIGFDERQPIAFQVLAHSIWKHTPNACITRLNLPDLPIKRRGLTAFTFSRYLVPYLSGFQGVSVFLDADMLALADISPLVEHAMGRDDAVFVVKNEIRFEWPSLMVFKNWHCKTLIPEFIEDTKNHLNDFSWAASVGELDSTWNHLVGYDQPQDAKIIHYTKGIPIWPETKDCEYSKEWHQAHRECNSSVTYQALMGRSVHAQIDRVRSAK